MLFTYNIMLGSLFTAIHVQTVLRQKPGLMYKGCPQMNAMHLSQYNSGPKLIKVRDTIEEVNVNGFLMNNIKFMPTIPQCVEIYQLCWL